ncbi:hypothetical protein PO124_02410 [Bacillus licheniformis]|nr:hypothetical protein [Bacillus licheniformis]
MEVADFGAGIPDTDQSGFSTRFHRRKRTPFQRIDRNGSLLGKSAADQLGHRIELDSQEGKGTTIRLISRLRKPYIDVMKVKEESIVHQQEI